MTLSTPDMDLPVAEVAASDAVQYYGACLAGEDVAMLVMEHCSVRRRLFGHLPVPLTLLAPATLRHCT